MEKEVGRFSFQKKILRYISVGLLYVFNILVSGCSADADNNPITADNRVPPGSESSAAQSSSYSSQSHAESGDSLAVADTTENSSNAGGVSGNSPDTPPVLSDTTVTPDTPVTNKDTLFLPPGEPDTLGIVALYGVIAPEYGVQIYQYRIIGEVRVRDTNEPVEGVEVRVRDRESGYSWDTSVNHLGRFEVIASDSRISRDFTVEVRDLYPERHGWFVDKDTTITAQSGQDNIVNIKLERHAEGSVPPIVPPIDQSVQPLYGVPMTGFDANAPSREP